VGYEDVCLKYFSRCVNTVIKPIWTYSYSIELWGCASKTNIAIIQTAQSKILRSITNAPWYVSNLTLHKDLKTPYVTETIRENSTKCYNKPENHSNPLLQPLLHPHDNRRLKRNWPAELRTKENVTGCLPTHVTKSVQLIVVNLYTSQHIDL
jgi:hypothetical protein